jgi:nucleoside-diphosphate-sugar epimerase
MQFHVEGVHSSSVPVEESVRKWLSSESELANRLETELHGVDVLVNAAGMAEPESEDFQPLFDANAVLPGVAAELASRAGVRRLVHISSAAVQGRRDPLDESDVLEPLTSYGRSKAAGELLLLRRLVELPPEVVIYRPTSVQGSSRGLTRKLAAFAGLPVVPLVGGGRAEVPVCLSQNVAAAVVHLVSATRPPPIVLQPSEGMTTKSLLDALGSRPRYLPVPGALGKAAVEAGYLLGRRSSRIGALTRRLDLLVNGQRQQAEALAGMGYVAPAGAKCYRALGDELRSAKG